MPKMKFAVIIASILFNLVLLWTDNSENIKYRIAVLSPTSENNTYWPQVYAILTSAAEDLGADLEIHEFDVGDRFAKSREGVKILAESPLVDGAILSVAFGQIKMLLDAAEYHDIPVIVQGPLFNQELPALGYSPRTLYTNWLATFSQNEEEKGYLLAKELIRAAVNQSPGLIGGGIKIIGISGDHTWAGSLLREKGLERAVEESGWTKLLQIVPTYWTPEESREKTTLLLKRYPDVRICWAASDQLGTGAVQAIKSAGKTPGSDIFTGGLDLSETGLQQVEAGNFTATVSATMFSYVEILIYLIDYLEGKDFKDDPGTSITSTTHTVTAENVAGYRNLYRNYEKIDFARFSKSANPSLETYDFSLKSLEQAILE